MLVSIDLCSEKKRESKVSRIQAAREIFTAVLLIKSFCRLSFVWLKPELILNCLLPEVKLSLSPFFESLTFFFCEAKVAKLIEKARRVMM